MKRKPGQTRGNRPKDDRIYPVTIGNFEIAKGRIAEVLIRHFGNAASSVLNEVTSHVNLRVTEIRIDYLSWKEAKPAVGEFKSAADALCAAIQSVSQLGTNDIGRSLGVRLLNSANDDYAEKHPAQPVHWQDVSAWLSHLSVGLEREFIAYRGGAMPYREFVWTLADLIAQIPSIELPDTTDTLTTALLDFFIDVDGLCPGLVFPEATVDNARRDYLRNAIRSRAQ